MTFHSSIRRHLRVTSAFGAVFTLEKDFSIATYHDLGRRGFDVRDAVATVVNTLANDRAVRQSRNSEIAQQKMQRAFNAVKMLMNAGADVNACEPNVGANALHIATARLFDDIVSLLVTDIRCKIDMKDSVGDAALHIASRRGSFYTVALLVAAGADVNSRDQFGNSPALYAVRHGHSSSLKMLLSAGASLDGIKEPFCSMACHSEFVVANLLSAGYDANVCCSALSPLHHAALVGNAACINLLLDAGADIASVHFYERQRSPLSIAGGVPNEQTIKALLVRDAPLIGWCTPNRVFLKWLLASYSEQLEQMYDNRVERDDIVVYDLCEDNAELKQARREFAALRFQRIAPRICTVCCALQSLSLPALVTLAIVDADCDERLLVTMFDKWNAIAAVKHYE